MKTNVKFISYEGDWPCLCYGTLTIEISGKRYSLENVLISGGYINSDYEACVGPWLIDTDIIPGNILNDLEPYLDEILEVVNENVEWGCCGGCI